MLYPLKFKPILKERIWGGDRLKNLFNLEENNSGTPIGECWSLSAVEGSLSVVENGFLAGNNITELVEIYMGDLVGDSIYQKFGVEFPLLIKLIDTNEFLSVQVHPDDEMAKERHHAFGKSEFWYMIDSQDDSQIITGFNKKLTRKEYIASVKRGGLRSSLQYVDVNSDDFIYIPSRSLHSLGKGLFLVEIQQTSDVTYRVYDWDRVDAQGKGRELHLDLAADTIDFDADPLDLELLPIEEDEVQELTSNPYFQVNRFFLTQKIEREFLENDSFRLYICLDGGVELHTLNNDSVHLGAGEIALVPASLPGVDLCPIGKAKVLEVLNPQDLI
ncbi:MAG: mannose-6-phosphate isomerase [Bacteroidales bacterium]|nr:mannose-6-phosphate isomerase [Bacteroidales bacterium]